MMTKLARQTRKARLRLKETLNFLTMKFDFLRNCKSKKDKIPQI